MRAQGGGHILQVSSIGGIIAVPEIGACHASKWALEGFSQSLAQEVAGFGIHVTLIEPGAFATDLAGASARRATPLAAYDEVREEAAAASRRNGRGASSGVPEATSAAVLGVVDAAEPPSRLFLGPYLLDVATAEYQRRLDTWQLAARVRGGVRRLTPGLERGRAGAAVVFDCPVRLDHARGMPANRPPRSDATLNRRRILAATREVVAERGVRAPIDEIVRRAGVGRGTFYRHFGDRESLLSALYEDALDELRTVRDAAAPDVAFEEVLRAAAPLQKDVFPFASALNREGSAQIAAAAVDQLADLVREPLAHAQRLGRVRGDIDTDDVVTLLTMIGGAVVFRPDADEQAHQDKALAFVLDAVRP